MSKIARERKDPHVRRPDPDLTAHEMMAKRDAESTCKAAQDLIDYLPPCYKEPLKARRALLITLDKYTVQVSPRG